MSVLKLALLGSPQFEFAGESLAIRRRKVMALLIYLVVSNEAQSRETLAALLWPEADGSRASASVRNALWSLKQVLGEGWLDVAGENIGLNPSGNLRLDVAEFRRLLAECANHAHGEGDVCAECRSFLADAVSLYRDDFLTGFTLPDCPQFDEWQFFQGQGLRQELTGALQRLVRWHAGQEEYEVALPYGRRWLSLDPFHEPAQRELIRLYAMADQRAAALRQYQECASLLGEELGIPPEAATTSLYEAIRTRRFPEAEAAPAGWSPPGKESAIPVMAAPPPFMGEEEEAAEREGPVFVGRRRELERLHKVLNAALHEQGQLIFVIGGAGRGKTMLAQEFARQAQDTIDDLLVVSGNGNAHVGIGDPYLPFREALTMLTGDVEGKWSSGLITSPHARRLWEAMPITIPALVERAPDLIDYFVSGKEVHERVAMMEPDDVPWFSQLESILSDPYREHLEQKHIFSQYTAVLKTIAAQRPLLLILEDLHWVDGSSTSLLFHLSRELGDSRILILGTYRPEEVVANWDDIRHPLANIVGELKRQQGDIWLDLRDVAEAEGRQFVDAYLNAQPNQFGEKFREALFQHTGGHAMFTVELLRAMREHGDIRQDTDGRWVVGDVIDWQTLPAKVEGVIEQRISRLKGELQSILNVASVEGESFTAEVVARVQQVAERRLVQQLSHELDKQHRLVAAQRLERLNGQRLSRYRFRHHLFQHYLYRNLSESERAYLHEEVGTVLEALYGDETGRVAVQLARHFQEAGITEKASNYLLQAGERSLQLSAFEEAIEHLSQGLNLLEMLPDAPERAPRKLRSLIALGHALVSTKGYTAPKVKETYDRARELSQEMGKSALLFPVLYGLWSFYYVSGDQQTAYDLAHEFLRQAKQQDENGPLMVAYRVFGTSLYVFGELNQSRAHLEQSIDLYDLTQHRSLAHTYGKDLTIAGPMYLSVVLSALGYQDQARQRMKQALSLAQESAHPFTSAAVLTFAAILYLGIGETQKAERYAERGINLCIEHKVLFFLVFCRILQGLALSERGQHEEAIAQMREGLAGLRAMGALSGFPSFLASLARAYRNAKQPEKGLAVLAEALALVEQTGERKDEAELHRLKGELLLMAEGTMGQTETRDDSPETCFQTAIEIARRQHAKWYELRATVRLCQLWQQRGRTTEARQMLAEIYAWFSEGFDTRDLSEAKALLDELTPKD